MKRLLWCMMPIVVLIAACVSVPHEAEPKISVSRQEPTDATSEDGGDAEESDDSKEIPAETFGPVFRLQETRVLLANGVLDTITENVYQDGLLVEEREKYADGTPSGRVLYEYDNIHPVRRTRSDGFGNVLSAHEFVYDGFGRLIKDSLLDTLAKPIFSYAYEYDDTGRRIKLEIYASDDILLSYSAYLFEDRKNVRIENYSTLNVLQEYLVRTFDDHGLPVLEVITEVGGQELEKVRYEYSRGLLARKETIVRTRKTGAEEYFYDEFENLTTRIRYDRTGKVVETSEYTYIEVSGNEE